MTYTDTLNQEVYTVHLEDDGTLDTVISVNGDWQRWDDLSEYRDEHGFNLERFMRELGDCVIDQYLCQIGAYDD